MDINMHADFYLKNKISVAFDNVKSLFPLKRIIMQFWRRQPTTATGRRLLTCSDFPYALSLVNPRLLEYRRVCATYRYSFDLCDDTSDPMIIDRAPPAYAALGHFPELDELAGVIEVSMRLPPRHFVVIFNELSRLLSEVGLRIRPPPHLCSGWPSKPIMPAFGAVSEIVRALSVAVEAHPITLGHVWIPTERHHPTRPLVQKFLWKSTSFCAVDPNGDDKDSFVKLLFQSLHVLPLKKVDVVVRRTLETHQPHLCRNIHKRQDHLNEGMLALLPANTKSSTCFVVCLRSSYTGELDHAFEFFWPRTRDHLALMGDLLSTLGKNLPSFKYASGAQLRDQVHVVDMENSSSSSGSGFTIFPGNKRPKTTTPKAVTRASPLLKKKFIHGQGGELSRHPLTNISSSQEDGETHDDDDLVIFVVVVYNNNVHNKLVYLPTSATFEDVMDRIKREFEHELLNSVGTYKVEYQVLPGNWYSLTNDACFRSCVLAFQTSENLDYIKFRVLAVGE